MLVGSGGAAGSAVLPIPARVSIPRGPTYHCADAREGRRRPSLPRSRGERSRRRVRRAGRALLADDATASSPLASDRARCGARRAAPGPADARGGDVGGSGRRRRRGEVSGTLPPGSVLGTATLTFRFDGDGKIGGLQQALTPGAPPPPIAVALDGAIAAAVNGALDNGTPIIAAYVDGTGNPSCRCGVPPRCTAPTRSPSGSATPKAVSSACSPTRPGSASSTATRRPHVPADPRPRAGRRRSPRARRRLRQQPRARAVHRPRPPRRWR